MSARARALVFACATASCGAPAPAPRPLLDPRATTITALPVAATLRVPGVDGPIELVTDRYGWPHVYATTLRDAGYGQGLAAARDRMAQMELLRRNASGTLAERFGAVTARAMSVDITMRAIGLRRAAQAIWDQTPAGTRARALLEGFAAGVNEYLRQVREGSARVPRGWELLVSADTPAWTPVDSLAVLKLLTLQQSYSADDEIARTLLRDRARTVFDQADAARAPAEAARRGFFHDANRFAPPATTAIVPGFYDGAPMGGRMAARRDARVSPSSRRVASRRAPRAVPALPRALLAHLEPTLATLRAAVAPDGRAGAGSNNWVVAGSATASGHALLANDPHLPLSSPASLWGVHLVVTGTGPDAVDAMGMAFPGLPGLVFGHNRHVAWGITNGQLDITDVYLETVTAGTQGAPDTVSFRGAQVPIERRVERVPNGLLGTLEVPIETVPHHGPILPEFDAEGRHVPRRGAGAALAVRWVGAEASREIDGLASLLYARTITDAQAIARVAAAPVLSFVLADDAGRAAYRVVARVPRRAPGALAYDPSTNPYGAMPATVLPGTGEAEWLGSLEPDQLPHADADAARPFFVTANNDPAGVSAQNNPFAAPVYIGFYFAQGWRAERITQRLAALAPRVTREDMAAIQNDHVLLAGARFRPFLAEAVARLAAEWSRPGSAPDLAAAATALRPREGLLRDAAARLAAWSLDSPAGTEPDATEPTRRDAVAAALFHAWIAHLIDRLFTDEVDALSAAQPSGRAVELTPYTRVTAALFLLEHPEQARTRDAATGQSAIWDDLRTPDAREGRDELIVRALDDALATLARASGSEQPERWLWGPLHTVRFASLVPNIALALGADLSIPPAGDPAFPRGFPRPGGIESVDQGWPLLRDASGRVAPVFGYDLGAGRRFTIEMDPAGPRAFDALPGGESWDRDSPHFRDEAELWRANRTHPLPHAEADVARSAERRERIEPAR